MQSGNEVTPISLELEEGREKRRMLADTIGYIAALDSTHKELEMTLLLDKIRKLIYEVSHEFRKARSNDNLRSICDKTKSLINVCLQHYADDEKRGKDIQAHMRETYRLITEIDKGYAELNEIREFYISLPTILTEIADELYPLEDLINKITECPEKYKENEFCVNYYAEMRSEFKQKWATLDERYLVFKELFLASLELETDLILDCNGHVHGFIDIQQISNFATKTHMKLSCRPPNQSVSPESPTEATPSSIKKIKPKEEIMKVREEIEEHRRQGSLEVAETLRNMDFKDFQPITIQLSIPKELEEKFAAHEASSQSSSQAACPSLKTMSLNQPIATIPSEPHNKRAARGEPSSQVTHPSSTAKKKHTALPFWNKKSKTQSEALDHHQSTTTPGLTRRALQ